MKSSYKVVCLQQRLTHYREGLFDRVRERLSDKGICFELVHGQPDAQAMQKKDDGRLDWAKSIENRYFRIGGRTAVWQSVPADLRNADMVILTQENKLLANYAWMAKRLTRPVRVAYWGHGRNFQSSRPNGALERWKKMLTCQVDWWFAYTDMTKEILLQDGYPEGRITVLDNAIDNEGFSADLAACSDAQLVALRNELGLDENSLVGLFCGSLYADKRLGFMLDTADRIRAEIPNFHLIVIGDGPNAFEIREACATRPWVHWVGVRKGSEKAAYFRLAHVVLNPGLVGLHVLDSFCAGTPMVTTADARHSPEIAYLKDGGNGLMVNGGVGDYANAVIDLWRDKAAYERLRAGALASAGRYTLQNMVNNFVDGVSACLATEKKR